MSLRRPDRRESDPTARRRGSRVRAAGRLPRACHLAALLLVSLAVLVTACGSDSKESATASSLNASSAAGSGGGSQGSSAQAFASCMRSHGVPSFPDPDSSGRFLLPGSVQNAPRFQSASQACQHLLPNGMTNGGGSGGGTTTTELVKFAQCMRSNGVSNFPDPTTGGGIGLPQGVDPNSSQFQSAWQACQSDLPGQFGGQQP